MNVHNQNELAVQANLQLSLVFMSFETCINKRQVIVSWICCTEVLLWLILMCMMSGPDESYDSNTRGNNIQQWTLQIFYWLHAKAIISVTKVWLEWRSLSSIGSHWDDTHLLLPTTGCTWFGLRCYLSLLDVAMILSWLDANHCTNILSLLFWTLHPYLSTDLCYIIRSHMGRGFPSAPG